MNKEIVSTPKAPGAIGPYSQAVKTGLVVFTSGQIGLDPATGELVSQDFEAQVRQSFSNLAAVAQAAGAAHQHVDEHHREHDQLAHYIPFLSVQ